jgi:putative intracellular protease/amidase
MNRFAILTALFFGILFSYGQSGIHESGAYVCPPCGLSCDTDEHDGPGRCSFCNMVLMKKENVKTIAFYLQDRVEVLDFAGPMEVLSYAGFEVFTVSVKKEPIKSQGILSVIPDYSIDTAPEADILAFFGGNTSPTVKNPKVIEWVKNQENIEYYFSVCTGAFILAEAGILDGKTATTFHSALDDLQNSYPKINVNKNVRFVDNGSVITTAGISAGIDGALHLVAKLHGIKAAKRIAYNMEYDNWRLGDGLILSDDNPYSEKIASSFLKHFEGTYEYRDDVQIEVKYNKTKGDLYAKINGIAYPVYHEYEDVFSDIDQEHIFFKRDDSNQIVGYSLAEDGTFYKKL